MTKKLTVQEQIKRIEQILNNDKLTYCQTCGRSYIWIDSKYEYDCPDCLDYEIDDLDEYFL